MTPIFSGVANSRILAKPGAAGGLDSHLNHAVGLLEGLLHAPRVVGIEGHGLFLVNVFPRLDSGNKMQSVQVLGCGDQDRVNGFVVEQLRGNPYRF